MDMWNSEHRISFCPLVLALYFYWTRKNCNEHIFTNVYFT